MSLAESTTSAVSPESPWLGLRPFTEDVHEYFFGRSAEVSDLFQRVVHKPLTLLFGRSGLGKSSLLQAALVPRLRDAGFLPVLLRLNYADDSAPLIVQFVDALTAALAPALPSLDEALGPLRTDAALSWLLFHDPAVGLTGPEAPRPIVLLDQFEEIFTMGRATSERQADAAKFLEMLADLVENRVPETLRSRLETDDALADRLDYAARPAKIVLSLREDFLHLLERYRGRMPSLMDNRFELRLLTGPQALEAVIKPGRLRCRPGTELAPLVSEATGGAIVRFVAGVAPDIPLAEIDAVPPLLSLLCAELNEQRLAAGESIIRPGQLEGRAEDILGQFYERCFSSQPSAVRMFVEDRLLSATGFRESTTLDTATHELTGAGLTHEDAVEAIAGLVDARLLTSEERDGVRRIELTHDILTSIARRSRTAREERVEKELADRRAEAERKAKEDAEASACEAAKRAAVLDEALQKETQARRDADLATRRARWLAAAAILVALVAIAACVFAAVQWSLAREATRGRTALKRASEQDYNVAHRLIREGDPNLSLNYLARSIEYDLKNELTRIALGQVLLFNQNFPLKLAAAPLRHEQRVNSAAFSPDGKFLATASDDRTARLWEVATGKAIGEPLRHEGRVTSAAFSPDEKLVATASDDGTARLWEAATGKAIGEPLRHGGRVNSAAFSPDGKFLATASSDRTVRLWEVATGKAIGEPMRHEDSVNSAAFSPDGKFLATASSDRTVRLWEVATGKAIGEPMRHEDSVNSAAFSPDGKFLVTASSDGTARVCRWFNPLSDSPEKIVAGIEQITFRKIAQDGGPTWIPPKTPITNSQLSESVSWFAEPARTRTIWPGALQTVPQFIVREIQDARRFREDQQRAKSILDNAYPIDPAHPLIHLALAMVEHDKQTAAFLRDYDLKRLPESCGYTKDLNPQEVLKLAAEMCAEQGDEERAQIARDKLIQSDSTTAPPPTTGTVSDLCKELKDKSIYFNANNSRGVVGPTGIRLKETSLGTFEFETEVVFPDENLRDSINGVCQGNNLITLDRKLWNGGTQTYAGQLRKAETGRIEMQGHFKDGGKSYPWSGWIDTPAQK